jgi:hypothetical protein
MHRMSTDDLDGLFVRLQQAVQAVEDPAAPRVAGKWCGFCTARQTCPEAQEMARSTLRKLVNPFVGGF